jgi:hypothetical protein
LFIGDDCNIKVSQVAKLYIVRTLRALKPFRKLLLCTSLTEIAKGRPFLFITMFIIKDRSRLLTSPAEMIPVISITGVSSEAPYEFACWYSAHRRFPSRKKRGEGSVSN